MITHQHIAPPENLKPYIRYFWVMENGPGTPTNFKTLADGCPGLIFYTGRTGGVYQNGRQLPQLFLYGQSTSHSTLSFTADFRVIGVYLQPHALKSVFGMRADLLTDGCLNIGAETGKDGRQLCRQLHETSGIDLQLQLISAYLLREISRHEQTCCPVVQGTISVVHSTNGNVSLSELRQSLRVTERTLERKFKESVGLSPKLFLRIAQFQASLTRLKDPAERLTDLAYENSYADQSHFIRSFKEFAGMSPRAYRQKMCERIANLPQLPPENLPAKRAHP